MFIYKKGYIYICYPYNHPTFGPSFQPPTLLGASNVICKIKTFWIKVGCTIFHLLHMICQNFALRSSKNSDVARTQDEISFTIILRIEIVSRPIQAQWVSGVLKNVFNFFLHYTQTTCFVDAFSFFYGKLYYIIIINNPYILVLGEDSSMLTTLWLERPTKERWEKEQWRAKAKVRKKKSFLHLPSRS